VARCRSGDGRGAGGHGPTSLADHAAARCDGADLGSGAATRFGGGARFGDATCSSGTDHLAATTRSGGATRFCVADNRRFNDAARRLGVAAF
jgi:hypothetical protein